MVQFGEYIEEGILSKQFTRILKTAVTEKKQ